MNRYYDWALEEQGEDYFLVTLCEDCASVRGSSVDHAETPPEWEELECEDCGKLNEQGRCWRVATFSHSLERLEA